MHNNTHPAYHDSNFQVRFWRSALDHFPEIPSPRGHSYHVTEIVVRGRRYS